MKRYENNANVDFKKLIGTNLIIINGQTRLSGIRIIFTGIVILSFLVACLPENNKMIIQSPDENIEVRMHLNDEQAAEYTIT